MCCLQSVCDFLEAFAPTCLAEDWDNVGLLVGDRTREVRRVMTCLTVTPASVAEAVAEKADLIVTHHPLPFRPVARLTADTTQGRMLLQLIEAGIAVYSPHTAFDSAAQGINQQLAEGLGLTQILPLVVASTAGQSAGKDASGETSESPIGAGRFGQLASETTLAQLVEQVKRFLAIDHLQIVGSMDQPVRKVAVACGAAGEFLAVAQKQGCDTMLLGETNFHTCLEAEASGVSLLLTGHFASERFAAEQLAKVLANEMSTLTIWASQQETTPLQWV